MIFLYVVKSEKSHFNAKNYVYRVSYLEGDSPAARHVA